MEHPPRPPNCPPSSKLPWTHLSLSARLGGFLPHDASPFWSLFSPFFRLFYSTRPVSSALPWPLPSLMLVQPHPGPWRPRLETSWGVGKGTIWEDPDRRCFYFFFKFIFNGSIVHVQYYECQLYNTVIHHFKDDFIYFFGCAWSSLLRRLFSSCGERGLLFVAAQRLLTVVASLVAEHRLSGRSLQQLWFLGSRAQPH